MVLLWEFTLDLSLSPVRPLSLVDPHLCPAEEDFPAPADRKSEDESGDETRSV